nr:methyltransferase domain-containing protein [Alphaproteobacteria bacterium]
ASSLRQAVALDPDNPDTVKVYGLWCVSQARFDEAVLAFERVMELTPGDPESHGNLGVVLRLAGNAEAAVRHLVHALSHGVVKPEYQAHFGDAVIEAMPGHYDEEIEKALLLCFEKEVADLTKLSSVAGSQVVMKYAERARVEDANAEGSKVKMHLDGILGDRLLLVMLEKTVSYYLPLEALLAQVRRVLLGRALQQQAQFGEEQMRFMAALSMQCHHNSYILAVDEQEERAIEILAASIGKRLERREAPSVAFEIELALFAMYRPLFRLPGFEILADMAMEEWSQSLRPLLQVSLINPAEEQALKAMIPALGDIEDETSRSVRSQYEENPYPRWRSVPRQVTSDLKSYLKEKLPWIDPPSDPQGGPKVLIAGSGTGWHPITFAQRIPSAHITAVDLSLSSLAYAKRMAQRFGVAQIDFRHGDLLDVDRIGEAFDVVESVGVIHHMKDPESGLAALLRVLRPGGYLKLGLYSERARAWITEARERVKKSGLEPTPEGIRRFRQMVLSGQAPDIERFVIMKDFFDLDSLRDLVFHVQEHVYRPLGIKDMLARHGLEFLGFSELKPACLKAYAEQFPADPNRLDLENWDAFESSAPHTFISMFNFWCRKPE